MSFSPLESMQVDCVIQTNATSSALYSKSPISLAGFQRADVLLTVGQMPATGEIVNMTILGGTANCPVTAMAAIANATVSVGTSSTAGVITKANRIRIHIMASNMSGTRITQIDGSSFLGTAVAAATVGSYAISTAATAVAKSLTTVIKTFATQLDATYIGTTGAAATAMDVEVWAKGGGRAISLVSTGQATADGISYQSVISQGVVSIRAADLLATNSSYSDIGVLVQTSYTSAIDVNVHVIRSGWSNPATNVVFHKKDLTTSGAK